MVRRIHSPKLKMLSMLFPALIVGSVQAESADMDYVQFSFVNADYSPLDDPLMGFQLEASKTIDDTFFGFGSYRTVDEDILDKNVEVTTLVLGAGMIREVDDKVTMVGKIMFIDEDLTSPSVENGESGFGVNFTAHYAINDEVELLGGMQLDDVENPDATFSVGAIYKFPENISAVGTLSDSDDGTNISIGARYSF